MINYLPPPWWSCAEFGWKRSAFVTQRIIKSITTWRESNAHEEQAMRKQWNISFMFQDDILNGWILEQHTLDNIMTLPLGLFIHLAKLAHVTFVDVWAIWSIKFGKWPLCVFSWLQAFILTRWFKNDNAHWHKWLPHLNQHSLLIPSKNGMVKNMLALRLDESLYKACQEGKQSRMHALCASEFRALKNLKSSTCKLVWSFPSHVPLWIMLFPN
jgi:hypothetical protein